MKSAESQAYYEDRYGRIADIQAVEADSISFPLHLHNDLELFLVRSGCIRVTVGKEEAELKSGEFTLIFPNMAHAYLCLENGSQYTMVVCSPSLAGEYLSRLTHYRPQNPFLQDVPLHPDIPYAMHGLVMQAANQPDEEIFRALIQLILARSLQKMVLEPAREPKSMDLTGRLIRYLADHFQESLSLDSVARDLAVSKYHLSHVFSNRLHTSFTDYVNFLRLNRARELLLMTDDSVLEIALSCGFSSQRTFNRTFREYFGKTPREFRSEKAFPPAQTCQSAEGKQKDTL